MPTRPVHGEGRLWGPAEEFPNDKRKALSGLSSPTRMADTLYSPAPAVTSIGRGPPGHAWSGCTLTRTETREATAADLNSVQLLHSATRPEAWANWQEHASIPRFQPRGETTFEHFYLSLQAAVAGVGVAIGPHALVVDDLREGRLVAPFGFIEDGSEYLFLSREPNDARVGRIRDWFVQEMSR